MTFGKVGEATLSQWMADNARVCWIEQSEPWVLESQLISQLDLPLNLDQNRHNTFHSRLKELRAQARQRARELPIGSQAAEWAAGPLPGPSLGHPRSLDSDQ
ncbi:GIY-YIG nuclease family protein [Streptomyces yanii]|uniref:GIY-YIG nuclease family protein n=1 Tax=Streptomyces yanii TaxID=78510 RepID=A0ABV5RA82_9ACTN